VLSRIDMLRHGLEQPWVTAIQMDRSEDRVENVAVVLTQVNGKDAIRLLVQTRRGVVEAIDGETGRKLWNAQVGNRDYPTFRPAGNFRINRDKQAEGRAAVVNGSTVYIYDLETGLPLRQIVLRSPATAAPAMGTEWVYIPELSNSIGAYNVVEEAVEPWRLASAGRPFVPPLVTVESLVWATTAGHVYVGQTYSPSPRFRLETEREITAETAYWAPYVYVASKDGFVYAVHSINGQKIWEFSAGHPMEQAPVALDGAVYALVDTGGMFQLDAATGQERWWAPGVRQVLSVSPTRIYTIDEQGRMLVLDKQTGSRLDLLNTELLNLRVLNIQSDRIYLGSDNGILQCLHERELVEPVIYHQPIIAPPPKPGEQPADATAAPADAAAPAAAMP
jgi:outer membrane protein assembly factor BamB